MFRLINLTDQEKLLFNESYIKELKKHLENQTEIASNAVKNLKAFTEDVRALSKRGARLIHYKEENDLAHRKNKRLLTDKRKLEHKNFVLREKIRELDYSNKKQ
jgi:hypothetical protein